MITTHQQCRKSRCGRRPTHCTACCRTFSATTAGVDVQVGPHLREQYSWCGAELVDHDLTRIAVPEGQDPRPSTCPISDLVAVDHDDTGSDAAWLVEHTDGDTLPEGICGRTDPAAAWKVDLEIVFAPCPSRGSRDGCPQQQYCWKGTRRRRARSGPARRLARMSKQDGQHHSAMHITTDTAGKLFVLVWACCGQVQPANAIRDGLWRYLRAKKQQVGAERATLMLFDSTGQTLIDLLFDNDTNPPFREVGGQSPAWCHSNSHRSLSHHQSVGARQGGARRSEASCQADPRRPSRPDLRLPPTRHRRQQQPVVAGPVNCSDDLEHIIGWDSSGVASAGQLVH